MTLLATITDADIGADYIMPAHPKETRTAVRAFLFDADGRMAYMWSGREAQHKLPGGGLEGEETLDQTLVREMREETGCAIHNVQYLGYVEEHRGRGAYLQTSHLHMAYVQGEKGTPQFDASEQARAFAVKWLLPDEARRLTASENTSPEYGLRFQNAREQKLLTFLPE
ncbi:MAG: NUDIX domain-containing protein [Alphaproteobacteria bacterium]|nr:MAG: NUDIX domain-containing protein [Alphaproteobacteria bacterium]